MNKQSKKPDIKEEFALYKLARDEKEYMVRCNKWLWNIAPNSSYPYQVGIATSIKTTDHDGFPSSEENQRLNQIEDMIIDQFTSDDSAIFAGTITGGDIKEFVLYAKNPDEARSNFNKLQQAVSDYQLQLNVKEDQKWNTFKTLCPK